MGGSGIRGTLPDEQGLLVNRRTASTALAAAGLTIAAPTNARWKVYHVLITLVTSATVGNRLILARLRDPSGNVIADLVNSGAFGTGRTVPASTTERYEWTLVKTALQGVTISQTMQAPFPFFQGSDVFIDDTADIDAAGDAVTREAWVEEWIEE